MRRHSGAWTLLPWKTFCSPRIPDIPRAPCSRPISVATMVSVCLAFRGTGRPFMSGHQPGANYEYGDSLLLLGHNSNLERLERNPNLIVLSQRHFPTSGKWQATIMMLFLGGIILTAVTGVLTPALSVPLAAIAALLLGCVKVNDTYKSVNWQAVATVGGMMSLGLALEKTGAAGALAHLIVTNLEWAGPNVILCALLALTVAMTQLIENAAIAIILAPIAYQIARKSHADPKSFMIGLAICISTSFCTPVAHETTMLVMGPGRYRLSITLPSAAEWPSSPG